MADKICNATVSTRYGRYGEPVSEAVSIDNACVFSVYNLCECPEDATVGRDLFDGNDYIAALRKGMELAQQGYTKIEVHSEEAEEEWG